MIEAALCNDRRLYKRFGISSLALLTEAANLVDGNELVILESCAIYVDSIQRIVFDSEDIYILYEQ